MRAEPQSYQFDTVEVQPAAFAVLREGNTVDLEPKAVRVLLYLIENRDRAVTKEELIRAVWQGVAVSDNALTRIVAQIRRELGDDARQSRYIQTLPTTGYRFIAPLREIHPFHEPTQSEPIEPEVLTGQEQLPPPTASKPQTARRFAIPIAAAFLGAVLLLTWFVWHRTASPGSHPVRAVQVTTSAWLDFGTAFSPDGNSFVYSSSHEGWFELYRSSISHNGGAIQLTNDAGQNVEPAWSPDGKWIAYHSAAKHGIWLVSAGGGQARRLTEFGSAPAWSPDSRSIAFSSGEPLSLAAFDAGGTGLSTIWTVALDGSQLRMVTLPVNPLGRHCMPAWSPDGKRIVFVAVMPESKLWSLDLETGKTELILAVGRDIPRQPGTWVTRLWEPKFSPKGEGLYFSAMREKTEYALYFLPTSGGPPREIYSTGTEAPLGLSISPDGRKLLMTRFSNVSQLWSVDEAGKSAPVFQESVLRAYLPSFSPDGKWFTFMVETAGRNRDLWIRKAEGGNAEPVNDDPGPKDSSSAWSPSGDSMFYDYVNGPKTEFRRYDLARRTSQVVATSSDASLFHPMLQPDGKELLATCSRPPNICVGNKDGAPLHQITFEREGAGYPFVSSDGQWIGYQVRRGDTTQIGVVRRDGSGAQILTNDPGHNWPYSFSPDGRRIAFAAYRNGVWNICWIDRGTRQRKQLTHQTAYGAFVRSPVFRPGTDQIVYESSEVKGNIYLLELR